MPAEVHYLPPRCPVCRCAMKLVNVHTDKEIPPVKTFACTRCEKDVIGQWQTEPSSAS
jgi:hypothetical protein